MQFLWLSGYPQKVKEHPKLPEKWVEKQWQVHHRRTIASAKKKFKWLLMKIEVIINGRVYLIKAKYQEQSSGIKTPKQFHAMVFNEKKACPLSNILWY